MLNHYGISNLKPQSRQHRYQRLWLFHYVSSLSSLLLLRNYPNTFAFIPSPAQPLVVETVVFMRVCGTLCPTLPQFAKVRFIVQLTCHGK